NAKKSAELSAAILDRLRPLHHRESIYAIARREQLRATIVRLSENDVPVMVPPPTGDADLIVYPRDRDKAGALARDIRSRGGVRPAIRAYISTFAAAGIPIEAVWTRARPGRIESVETLALGAEDAVLLLALDLATRLAKPGGSVGTVRVLSELGAA